MVWVSDAGSIGQRETSHHVVHELGHIVGLWHAGNDENARGSNFDSVMAYDQERWQQFTKADLLVIEMLYRPEVERSMSVETAAGVLRDL
jgi:hypothetical protein